MKKREFTLERLETLLLLAKKKRAFIRHDVDHSCECALKMAEFESELKIKSTYYIRRQSDARLLAPKLTELGHKLGLHVDLRAARGDVISNGKMLAASRSLFSTLSDAPYFLVSKKYPFTKKVSFHSPPSNVLWRDIKGFDHALGSKWKGRYVSDSRGVWRYDPEELLLTVKPLQINLHSEWWWLPDPRRQQHHRQEMARP